MIRYLIVTAIIFIAIVFGISFYLQSDDLAKCDNKPSYRIGCNAVDAIVAISGGDTGARTKSAIDLYKNGWANTLIFSGAALDKNNQSNAAAMKRIAIDSDVPESAIRLDEFAENTKQNAVNSQTIFKELGIKKVILVTSGYHQRRAGLEFNKRAEGVKIINHPDKNDKDWSIWWWLTPVGWYLTISEAAKIGAFYVMSIF